MPEYLFAHELPHALVARRQGVRVERTRSWMLGGVAQRVSEPTTPAAVINLLADTNRQLRRAALSAGSR